MPHNSHNHVPMMLKTQLFAKMLHHVEKIRNYCLSIRKFGVEKHISGLGFVKMFPYPLLFKDEILGEKTCIM